MKILLVTFLGTLFITNSVFSMGGDKPGPHEGYITMPGTYHVELVDKGNLLLVYLLDISMKNPTVANSRVSLKFVNDKEVEVSCKAKNKYFVCNKPNIGLEKFKEIKLESTRNKVKAEVAIYKLPLQFDK
ncbi:MAG: hypothetical protein PHY93_16925 [Bacteriovorax sp.]|nr:hypothetical protein [Bacteriovorax sp.]